MRSFHTSMPDRYRATFDGPAIQAHAAIVARRTGVVHLEVWQRLPDDCAILCIVAEDKPGLLSLISAALVANNADIVAVKAYTRQHPESGRSEAIDFVWVKRSALSVPPFVQSDFDKIRDVLIGLLTGAATVESILRKDTASLRSPPIVQTRVEFQPGPERGPSVLVVETADRPGLLLAITQALFRAELQIVASDARTQSGRAVDHFTVVERDGAPLDRLRRRSVQTQVTSAIEALYRVRANRRSSRPPKPPPAQ